MIEITPKALVEIKSILATKSIPDDYSLRLLVEGGGGCGGARFRLGFDRKKEGDESFEVEGVSVIYEKKTLLFLLGFVLDFEERSHERGFLFRKKENYSLSSDKNVFL